MFLELISMNNALNTSLLPTNIFYSLSVQYGVPQESVFGTPLYQVYMADLSNVMITIREDYTIIEQTSLIHVGFASFCMKNCH